jgi:hypothetical protein
MADEPRIVGVTFELLDTVKLKEITRVYSSTIPCIKHITHIGDVAILPHNCTPNIHRPDGEYKDNLNKIYNKLSQNIDHIQNYEHTKKEVYDEIASRWMGGKTNRWRQDICGKRCNFTARSVLSPNPHNRLIQVGLPNIWRRKLTLSELWLPSKQINIVAVIGNCGKKFHPRFCKPVLGTTVIRELNEGELVLVNRQPTLRETNFVAMEVIWHTGKTIQMHPGVFSMFDADCDGDEINIHLPQIPQEELEGMHIKHCIRNFADMSLTPSVIQDATIGICLLGNFKRKREIHDSLIDAPDVFDRVKEFYDIGCNEAYKNGFSIGFDFKGVDFMISSGAKGKTVHKEKIRKMLAGVYNNEEHFKSCQEARDAVISTSLKTAETGYISRRLSYHLDDVVRNSDGNCVDYGKWLVQYPNRLPSEVSHIKHIGLHLVTVVMPPLTQKMLDSFHTVAAGEKLINETSLFNSLINCSSIELKSIFETSGLFIAKHWLFTQFQSVFKGDISDFWIQFLVDFLCMSGYPIGVGMTRLQGRLDACNMLKQDSDEDDYSDDDQNKTKKDNLMELPVFKFCKFGNPLKNLIRAAKNNVHDNLSSYHSREIFI